MNPRTSKPSGLTKAELAAAALLLSQRDPQLRKILNGLGPPPMWARTPGFSTLVHIILEQQVSLASAASVFARLQKHTVPFTSARICELGTGHLKGLGLTRQKAAYVLGLAEAVNDGTLRVASFNRLPDEEVRNKLLSLKGIGPWSADVYLLMALRRPDVWPAGDLALAVAVQKLKRLEVRPAPGRLERLAERWRPFRSVAARMLWQYYLNGFSTEATNGKPAT